MQLMALNYLLCRSSLPTPEVAGIQSRPPPPFLMNLARFSDKKFDLQPDPLNFIIAFLKCQVLTRPPLSGIRGDGAGFGCTNTFVLGGDRMRPPECSPSAGAERISCWKQIEQSIHIFHGHSGKAAKCIALVVLYLYTF